MPGTYFIFLPWIYTYTFLQELDAGIYQAKVVSSAGECYSSCMRVEVEPGPEWPWHSQWYYGAKMATVEPAGQGLQRLREAQKQSEKYGVFSRQHLNYPVPHNSRSPTGWIEGTVGSWRMKLPYEGMSREVEAEGWDALEADMGNTLYKYGAKTYPGVIEGKDLADVSEKVRQAISRIMKEKDMDLDKKLEANLDAVHQHINEEDDWPAQTLIKSKEKMLVDSSLNHTWQTHIQWEQEQADAWRKSFAEDPVGMLRWTGFRSKRQQSSRKLRLNTSNTSSSDSSHSMSSSDSDEEGTFNYGAAPPAPMSVRVGDEEQGWETSDDQEEEEAEDALPRLERLLLNNHDEEKVPK